MNPCQMGVLDSTNLLIVLDSRCAFVFRLFIVASKVLSSLNVFFWCRKIYATVEDVYIVDTIAWRNLLFLRLRWLAETSLWTHTSRALYVWDYLTILGFFRVVTVYVRNVWIISWLTEWNIRVLWSAQNVDQTCLWVKIVWRASRKIIHWLI